MMNVPGDIAPPSERLANMTRSPSSGFVWGPSPTSDGELRYK